MKTLKDLPKRRGLPLLGNLHQLDKNAFHLSVEQWARDFGLAPFRLQIASMHCVVFSEPEQVRYILKHRPSQFRRMKEMARLFDEVGFSSLFTDEGESWKRQRRLVMPAFAKRSLVAFTPQIASTALKLRDRLRGNLEQALDLRDDLRRFSVDVSCLLVFGFDLKSLENDYSQSLQTFHDVVNTINNRMRAVVPYWRVFKLPSDHRFDRSMNDLKNMVIGIARDTRERMRHQEDVGAHCILHTMLEAVDSEEGALTDDELFANMMALILAGEGTTSAMLGWLCYFLGQDPVLQDNLRNEVASLDLHQLDYHALADLPLTEAVIEETFRIKSTLPLMVMETLEDTVIDDIELAQGTKMLVLTRIDGLKDLEQDSVFNPYRWLDEPHALIDMRETRKKQFPYGYGPRSCPGASLAHVELKVAVAMLVKYFDLELIDKDQIKEVFTTFAVPDKLKIRLGARPAQETPTASVARKIDAA
ncbi:Cytochrome P450 [Pseudomonas sp. LAMO17WK12:I10]|uniref:cytochrome P450 n=1 Tax=unclassified Pseudomonas TaxID=196821 RepID=UPI000BDA56EE|nr:MULTISPECIES: cytochrome P450 [unclassified Pseudomonas]PXX69498.1 cytochrome P450 [Pseudomonas sp. LAMO17WK12:I9]SNY32835.1 Cytochrome P450 [Pseudomonas sp. LAMO17WK12:I10]